MEQGNQPKVRIENNFRLLDQNNAGTTAGEAPQEGQPTEEPHGKSNQETIEIPAPEIEEEKANTGAGKDVDPNIEEGEVSLESEYEGASDTLVSPKKAGRGRKSKKEERDKET